METIKSPDLYTRGEIKRPEEVWSLASETNKKGEKIFLINDFDGTVSTFGESKGLMPFDTHLHPIAAASLKRMQELGHPIGAVSNRSTDQIREIYRKGGIDKPFVSGTYGHVLAIPDSNEPTGYRKIVDERFRDHYSTISAIQSTLRHTLLAQEGFHGVSKNNIETEEILTTPYGRIFIENKDIITEGLPYGLAADYNMNELPPEERFKLTQLMRDAAASALEALSLPEDELNAFKKLWGIHSDSDHPENTGNYTFKSRPLSTIGKGKAMMRLLREVEKSEVLQRKIGLIIYGGDHPRDDKSAMRADRLFESFTGGDVKAVGILINSNANTSSQIRYSDLRMRGVPEYAGFLLTMSNILQYERRLLGVGLGSSYIGL